MIGSEEFGQNKGQARYRFVRPAEILSQVSVNRVFKAQVEDDIRNVEFTFNAGVGKPLFVG